MAMSLVFLRTVVLSAVFVVTCTRSTHAQAYQAAITRFEFDGALDETFGGDGHVITNIANSQQELFNCGAPTTVAAANDRIIAAGARLSSAGVPQLLLARYITNTGALDSTFGTGGLVTQDIAGFDYKAFNRVALDSSRRIVTVAHLQRVASGRDTISLARYTSAGVLDAAFNTTGRVIFNFDGSSSDVPYGIAIDSSGRIVVAATSTTTGGEMRLLLARFTVGGAFDTTFGSNGRVRLLLPGTTKSDARDVAVDANGRIVVAGRSATAALADRGFVARFSNAGALDPTFNSNGVRLLSFPGRAGVSAAYDVAIDGFNNYTIAGRSLSPSTSAHDLAVARILPSGSYDNSFGGDGRVTTALLDEAGSLTVGLRVVFPNNLFAPAMIVAGVLQTFQPNTSIVTTVGYNADGTLFTGWGSSGIAMTQAPGVGYHGAVDAFTTGDGRITALGYVDP